MIINYHILALSIVQSLTEFLPVSSSGHLILFPQLFNIKDYGILIDAAVHFGSILAVIIYFHKPVIRIIKDTIKAKFKPNFKLYGAKVFYMLIVGTIPIVIAGLFLHKFGLDVLRSQKLVACTLIGFGVLLGLADKICMTVNKIEHLNLRKAFFIGCAQCLALIPGTSRSGITITACRFLAMERREATQFSMLLAIPAIFGATILIFFGAGDIDASMIHYSIEAVLYSFIGGLAAIYIIMSWLKKSTFMPFVLYRIVFGCYLLLDSYGVF